MDDRDDPPRPRLARRADVPAMQRVRAAVRENRLVSVVLSDVDYVRAIEEPGRGWVVEAEGEVVGFAAANARDGNVWALFVDPRHEGRGLGRRLHDTMIAWLAARGLERAWLTTDPGTRAERFYTAAGWCAVGRSGRELRLELLLAGTDGSAGGRPAESG